MAVRWDAVVDRNPFWCEPVPAVPAVPAASAEAPVSVEVWMFGALASALAERPFRLQLSRPFGVNDVIAELDRRCGGAFLACVIGPDGSKFAHCHVFVDGQQVDDTSAPVACGASPCQVELILLTATEGG